MCTYLKGGHHGPSRGSEIPTNSVFHLGCAFAQFKTKEASEKCLAAAQTESEVSPNELSVLVLCGWAFSLWMCVCVYACVSMHEYSDFLCFVLALCLFEISSRVLGCRLAVWGWMGGSWTYCWQWAERMRPSWRTRTWKLTKAPGTSTSPERAVSAPRNLAPHFLQCCLFKRFYLTGLIKVTTTFLGLMIWNEKEKKNLIVFRMICITVLSDNRVTGVVNITAK